MSGLSSNITSLPITIQYPDSSIGDVKFTSCITIPNGWMECDGRALSRTVFSELFAKIGTTFGVGDGVSTFNIPDLRGEFIRGWDHGRGIDSGRSLGTEQLDAFQGHLIQFGTGGGTANGQPLGSYSSGQYSMPWGATIGNAQSSIGSSIISDGNNGNPRIASETRPRNVALVAIIKVKNIAGYDPYVYRGNALTLGGIPASGFLLTTQGINFKNKIINGNFDIWQRGLSLTSFSGANKYLADRWCTIADGSSTATISRQSFTLGQGIVSNEPTYFHRAIVGSVESASSRVVFLQKIEGVRTLAGKTVTLSFWAKADANKNMAVEFVQSFGTGGSPSSLVSMPQLIALSTSWQKYTLTVNLPTLVGKTLGTNPDDHLDICFWFDVGSNYTTRIAGLGQQSGTFDIAQVQLEEGSVVTSFEYRPYQVELAMCQRYFEKSYDIDVAPGTYSVSGARNAYSNATTTLLGATTFMVVKRVTPTVAIYSPGGTYGKLWNISDVDAGGGAVAQNIGLSGFRYINSAVATTLSQVHTFHFTADAEL